MLKEGMTAPDFALPDEQGQIVRLSDMRGRKVVLYFYPKDNTPGCTRQAGAFGRAYEEFERAGVAVLGVSRDSPASHRRFKEKNALPFTLLSDPDHSVHEAYGVWQKRKLYGREGMGVVRTSFVIDEKGVIEKVFEKVRPDTNAREILDYLGA